MASADSQDKGTSVPFFHRGFDFDAAVQAPFRMQPGLRRRAADAPVLTPCLPASRHLPAKLAVLAGTAADALLQQPGFDGRPPLARVAAALAQAHPAAWRVQGATWLALFGIHVDCAPLAQALAAPAHARQVASALASMSPAVLTYRGPA